MKEFKIVPIRNGTVLDHILPGRATKILEALGHPIEGSSKVISISMHLPSTHGTLKDVLKFEDLELDDSELAAVQEISPRGTLNVIRNFVIAEKETWGLDA